MHTALEKFINDLEMLKLSVEELGVEDEDYDAESVIAKLEEIEEYYSTFLPE